MALSLARLRVVLVAPSLPDNVGSVARAMGNFGAGRLVLVGGVEPTHERARVLAAGHDAVLEAAIVVPDLEEAIAGCALAIGTTARPQGTVDRIGIGPAEAGRLAAAHLATGDVALVLGTESRGLTNDELRRCDQLATIPGEAGTCLNLAQAAAVLLWAFREAAIPDELAPTQLAAAAGLDHLAERLMALLDARGLVKEREQASKLHTLRRILSRASLAPDEAALVTGWLRALVR